MNCYLNYKKSKKDFRKKQIKINTDKHVYNEDVRRNAAQYVGSKKSSL